MNDTAYTARPYWFVGSHVSHEDETARFLQQGIWETNHSDPQVQTRVREVEPGDQIAIKAVSNQLHGLPFDYRGKSIGIMYIKATGTVLENPRNGQTLKVQWNVQKPTSRKWYSFTYRGTIWKVLRSQSDKHKALIDFAFKGKPQDIEHFIRADSGKGRDFPWIDFYESVATALLGHKGDRKGLVSKVHEIISQLRFSPMVDQFGDGTEGPLRDICPFTVMGLFNRQYKSENRKIIATELANFLQVDEPSDHVFQDGNGVPVLDNRNSWFFGYEVDRKDDDIDVLWDAFAAALKYADAASSEYKGILVTAFNDAKSRHMVGLGKLTMGFYWARPWAFPTLDDNSRDYIEQTLKLPVPKDSSTRKVAADDYFKMMQKLKERFEEGKPPRSFPELCTIAYWGNEEEETGEVEAGQGSEPDVTPYSIDGIVRDGCFIERKRLDEMLDRLNAKKNLILQGPPGTGKTWLAKRLAYALMEEENATNIRHVQFHPNLSYEDFVQGYRPSGSSKLDLVDGVFMQAADAAREQGDPIVVVIEEINRGNPAQVFGEMLTLLEGDKRGPEHALELSYSKSGERFHLPENLYVIGTMNLADRSLALVDLALRRRFAFVDLKPEFGELWRGWVSENRGLDQDFLQEVARRLSELNSTIREDGNLGEQFCVGHSYFTPPDGKEISDPQEWFRQVVETELVPYLREVWFDAPDRVEQARQGLISEW